MDATTYTTYSLRKAAVLLACGVAPTTLTTGDASRVQFVYADPNGRVADLMQQHNRRELRLIPDDVFDGQAQARRLVEIFKYGPRQAGQ